MKPTRTSKQKPNTALHTLPAYCDFNCTHASFPPSDAVGACRREQAVYCTLLKKYNNRNNKCIARQ